MSTGIISDLELAELLKTPVANVQKFKQLFRNKDFYARQKAFWDREHRIIARIGAYTACPSGIAPDESLSHPLNFYEEHIMIGKR